MDLKILSDRFFYIVNTLVPWNKQCESSSYLGLEDYPNEYELWRTLCNTQVLYDLWFYMQVMHMGGVCFYKQIYDKAMNMLLWWKYITLMSNVEHLGYHSGDDNALIIIPITCSKYYSDGLERCYKCLFEHKLKVRCLDRYPNI